MEGNRSRPFESLILDGQTFQFHPKKIARHFVAGKYALVLRDLILPFKEGETRIMLFGRPYYYASRFGIGFLQNVFMEDMFLRDYLKPGATIIDVGANIGQFNTFCRVILEAKRVLSFEPLPSCAALLRKNVDEMYECAVTCAKEVVMRFGDSTLTATSAKGAKGAHTVVAKGIRLDEHEHVKELKVIDLLKIDTEGTEMDVLRSAEGILHKVRFVLVEASITRPNSGDVEEVRAFLAKQNPPFRLAATGMNYLGPSEQVEALDILFAREKELIDLKK